MTVARIGQELVGAGAAVAADALREHGLVDQRHLARLDEPARARVGVLPRRKPCDVQVRAVERCRARLGTAKLADRLAPSQRRVIDAV